MRVAEYKQIGVKLESHTVHHDAEYDENGDIATEEYDETVTVEIPVMGVVYRDMTAEEIKQMESVQYDSETNEKSAEERIAELEQAFDALLNGVTE